MKEYSNSLIMKGKQIGVMKCYFFHNKLDKIRNFITCSKAEGKPAISYTINGNRNCFNPITEQLGNNY